MPKSVAVLPIKGLVLVPGQAVPLRIGRTQSIAAVDRAKLTGLHVVAVAQKNYVEDQDVRVYPESDLYRIGTYAKIEKIRGNSENGYQIVLRGISRFEVNEFTENDDVIYAHGEEWKDSSDELESSTALALRKSLKEVADQILDLMPSDNSQIVELISGIEDLSFLGFLCLANVSLDSVQKQEILEVKDVKSRTLRLLEVLQKFKAQLEVQGEIRDKMSHRFGKQQREAILREQLKTIQDELGELDSGGKKSSTIDYEKKIEEAGMPEEVKKTALEEWRRLESMPSSSAETHVIRNYLDLFISLPWNKSSAAGAKNDFSDLDLDQAKDVLNADHYGLDQIKARVLQHLAVMKLKKSARGQILLFVGPPGVGKTSLGQSIAKALGRKFVRGSLGGVRDDAEIRGHRRTYVGAMPGRIIQGFKRAQENDPVFMLDEIDKMGRGWAGDPAGALLEVLDPEQNGTFLDHYLDVPFDLSKTFFIATANSLENIPAPLLDRMEVIDVSGYTTPEKLHIAKNHLIPKQWKEHGIGTDQLVVADDALLRIIHAYTREAGVRDLQRKLATVCRAMAEKVLRPDRGPDPVRVEISDLDAILGQERYVHEVAERINPPGVVTGMAWTPQGGEILFIESNLMPGKGNLILTGQLGDVMKESAQIALSLVRSRLSHVVPEFNFEKNDIHVHVPAGAIPKDGPSAGVTMLSTLASLLTGVSVSSKLAMSGEITLRGAVMPVGGIKEKVIAAHRAGIERIILSKRNQKDLKDVPEEVKSAIHFEFVDTVSDVLKVALGISPVQSPLDLQQTSGQDQAPSQSA